MIIMELPENLVLEYFAEGAANVVCKMSIEPSSPSTHSEAYSDMDGYGPETPPPSEVPMDYFEPSLHGKLLRLRKDLPTATFVYKSQKDFEMHIKPHFETNEVVEQSVVKLPPHLVENCNVDLHRMEARGTRPSKRCGVYVKTNEGFGTLVTDMTSRPTEGMLSLEFKPKWLAQSPTAPENAKRCRTCALRALNSSKQSEATNPSDSRLRPKAAFCPLALVSEDKKKLPFLATELLRCSDYPEYASKDMTSRLVIALSRSSILHKLKDLQVKLDPKGVLKTDPKERDLLTAMTLRDCTLYLKVGHRGHLSLVCYISLRNSADTSPGRRRS